MAIDPVLEGSLAARVPPERVRHPPGLPPRVATSRRCGSRSSPSARRKGKGRSRRYAEQAGRESILVRRRGRTPKLLGGPLADPRYLAHPDIEQLVQAILGPENPGGAAGAASSAPSRDRSTWAGTPIRWSMRPRTPRAEPHGARDLQHSARRFHMGQRRHRVRPGNAPAAEDGDVGDPLLDIPNVYSVRPDLASGRRSAARRNTLHRGAPKSHRHAARDARPDLPDRQGGDGVTGRTIDVDISGLAFALRGLDAGACRGAADASGRRYVRRGKASRRLS